MSSSASVVTEEPVLETIFEKELSSEEPPMEEWSSLEMETIGENIKRQQYAEGLYDPGSGEICTKYIPLSASSVFRHVYYNYPGIPDPGIEEALLMPEPRVIYPDDGQELYLAVCKEMDLCPVRAFYRELLEEKINLKYYGVNPKGFRAMAMALKLNRFVRILDLTDNWINDDGCFHLGEMLIDNITLQELNLTGCRIGPSGARRLFANLPLNQALRTLNLSKNELCDEGVELLATAIFRGADITNLNLSFNKLTGKSPMLLAEAFETHNKLTHLDMSWNSMLSPNGIFALCSQLASGKIVEVNLSWNALTGTRVGNAVKVLLSSPKIRYVNMSNNRLEGQAIKSIGIGLMKAKELETLNLSFNPMSAADATKLLERFREKRVKLKQLLLDNVIVDSNFLDVYNEIRSYKFRKDTVITWGGIRTKFVPKGTDMRDLLFNRCEFICKKPKKRKVDIALLIQEMYRNDPEPLSVKMFIRTLKSAGVSLDEDLIEEMANRFPGPKTEKGDKTLNLESMIDYLKRKWPDRKLPPPPPPESLPEPPPVPAKKDAKEKEKKKK